MRTHLDLGCGLSPKNPFGCESLYGIDIRASDGSASSATIVTANLGLEPIPFPDNYFDSVSAYDFFEHIPRVALDFAKKSSRFPFIELMNEIWRVLKPNGILYSVTPAFPSEKAFRDPTHVNIITKKHIVILRVRTFSRGCTASMEILICFAKLGCTPAICIKPKTQTSLNY